MAAMGFATDGHSVATSVSIGLASRSAQATDASGLLARADVALYEAKAQGRNCVVAYTAERAERPLDAPPRLELPPPSFSGSPA